MVRISIDATAIRDRPSGVGLYARQLISELGKLQSGDDFALDVVYQPSMRDWLKNNHRVPSGLKDFADVHRLPVPVTVSHLLTRFPSPLRGYYSRYFRAPDIVHGTDHVVYPHPRARKVMTIHDVTFIKYPQFVNNIVRTYTARIKDCLGWTDLIIANSESTKRDIIQYLGVDDRLILVTPLASRYADRPGAPHAIPPRLYDVTRPYILFVGTIEPRKNLTTLIEAFNRVKGKYKLPHDLLLVGQKGWLYEPIFRALEQSPHRESIHHLDYLSDDAVAELYRRATVFVYPSIYEGFGLPVLEAMTLGCPVITAATSSLPEVAGDAALLIDPADSGELGEAIFKIIADESLRDDLIARGRARAGRFSWGETARLTLNAYRSIL